MTACPQRSYSNITRPIFNAIIAEVGKRADKTINPATIGDSGETSGDGYSFRWAYTESSAVLIAQCTDSPWYAPCLEIGNAMDEMVTNARKAVVQSINV